jgi:glycosyltransferase involved in cell wall biosynthesis
MLVEPLDGISRYALEIAGGLPAAFPSCERVLVGHPERLRRLLPGTGRIARARTTSISLGEQLELPALLYRHRVDLFHATLFVAPLAFHRPHVLTLHDVNYMALPELYGRHRQLYFEGPVRLFARRAAAVVTVSEFSRIEIERRLGIPAERVEVIPNGVDPRFSPVPEQALASTLASLGLAPGYVLYVGSYAPHKNVPALIRAYASLGEAPPLVLCSRCPERIEPLVQEHGLADRVRLLSGCGDDVLPALYSGASVFVFPSRYEGFGLPPLEAMACGTPAIVADAGSLPEVTGGAALTFPPDDASALARQIDKVIGSPSLRASLSLAGRLRATQFTWRASVARHAALYRRLG